MGHRGLRCLAARKRGWILFGTAVAGTATALVTNGAYYLPQITFAVKHCSSLGIRWGRRRLQQGQRDAKVVRGDGFPTPVT